jgi:hypothetical protein
MKQCVLILTFFIFNFGYTQSVQQDNLQFVKTGKIEGNICNENYDFSDYYRFLPDSVTRYTLTPNEVNIAERLLTSFFRKSPKSRISPYKGYRNIRRNNHKYFRHYVGIKSTNSKYLIIKASYNRNSLVERLFFREPKKQYNESTKFFLALDGGSNHWIAVVDLDRGIVVSFGSNGIA